MTPTAATARSTSARSPVWRATWCSTFTTRTDPAGSTSEVTPRRRCRQWACTTKRTASGGVPLVDRATVVNVAFDALDPLTCTTTRIWRFERASMLGVEYVPATTALVMFVEPR